MGGHNSKASIDQTALNKTISNTVVKNQVKNTTSADTIQSITIKNTKFLHCNFQASQEASIKMNIIQEFTNETSNELKNKIKQELESQLENKMKPEAELFGPPMVTNTDSKLRTTVENIIETNVSVESLNEQVSKINAMQTQDFDGVIIDKCPGYDQTMDILASRSNVTPEVIAAFAKTCDQTGTCGIDQNLKVDLFVQQVTTNLVKAIQDNDIVQKETAKVVNEVAPKSTGISGLMGFGLFGGSGSCSCVIIMIIVFIMLSASAKKIKT